MSVTFSLKKIDLIGRESSPGEMEPLIKCCRACSLESGEGGSPAGIGDTDVAYVKWTINGIIAQR